uniref:Uncharacterized protein n=1 Tax=Eptatretus burgeri TaxID=7764 RepID=A0A8C4QXC3_EPTBU
MIGLNSNYIQTYYCFVVFYLNFQKIYPSYPCAAVTDNVPESGIPLLTPADAWKTDEQLRQPPIAAPRSIRLVEKTESLDIDYIKDGTDQDSGLCLELSEGRPDNEVHESIQNQQSPLAAGSGIVCDEKDGKNITIAIPRPAPRTVNGGRGSVDCKRESVLSRVQEIEKATRQSPLGGVLRPPGQVYLPENTCCNNGLPTSMALVAAELKRKRASGDSALGEGDSVLPGRVITCTPRSCDLLAVSPDNALAVNPVPKPRRTFQHKTDVRWDNGRSDSALKDRMAIPRKSLGLGNRLQADAQRKSFEFEDCLGAGRARLKPLNRLMSSPPGQCVSGRLTTPRTVSQENIYEDVTAPTCVSRRGVPVSHRPGGPREHPYEDVGSRCWLGWRRGLSVPLPGNSPSKPWSNFCKSGMPMRVRSNSLEGTFVQLKFTCSLKDVECCFVVVIF